MPVFANESGLISSTHCSMPPVDLSGLAILLTALGLFTFLVVRLMLKVAPHFRADISQGPVLDGTNLVESHEDGVLIIEAGGRIRSINPKARQIFRLLEGETPNLERLARKVRPGEALIRLCASEGRTRFILEGRLVEGFSYLVQDNRQVAVITLRYPELTSSLFGGQGTLNSQTLQTFTQLTQAMAASLDLEKTLQAVLENVEKLLPADFMEITVWDVENEVFIPYRFSGFAGAERQVSLGEERYTTQEGISSILFRHQKPLLVADIETRPDLKYALAFLAVPVRSFLGLPLLVGNEAIGTLELGSMAPDTFREEDLHLLRLLSGQAGIAIHNALLYKAEQKRTAELTGLAQLAQAFSSARNPAALFTRLVESIVPLVSFDILGFLIYNESHRTLEAQMPFHGLPDQIVELYRAPVQNGSSAEKILLDQDLLITENASEDEKWLDLGLEYIAQAASLRETVLVPLTTGGHMLGYLQASNHNGGTAPFNQAELHLLLIVANQTASIIENATLVHQSRQRAQRAESLRRVASLASSAASLDEILKFSVQELARLLRADLGAVFLLQKQDGELKLHHPSIFGSLPELPEKPSQIVIDDPQFHFTVTGSQHILTIGRNEGSSPAERAIIPFYQAMIHQWNVKSLIAVPLVVRNEGIGELWFAGKGETSFDQADAQVAATAAGQLASVVEQWHLRGQTDDTLRRQLDQMTAITRIGRELSTSLDLNSLLNLVYEEALRTTRADCGTILLFDLEHSAGPLPLVRFSVGDMHDSLLSPLEQRVLEGNQPLSIADFSQSDFAVPHPGVQSTLIAPITYQRKHAGLICLHGKQVAQFDATTVEITQSLAVQAAIALNNALAYELQTQQGMLLKREIETLTRLIQVSRVLKPSQSLETSLMEIARAIQAATPFQVVLISVYESELGSLRRAAGAGISPEMWEELRSRSQPWQSLQQLMLPEYKNGEAYFIPGDSLPAIPEDVHLVDTVPDPDPVSSATWRQRDMLLIPMYDIDNHPLGLISVDAPADNLRPDQSSFEALEVFAAQASIMIESTHRTSRLERQVGELENERIRLENALEQSRTNLPILLHKELDHSIALRTLNQRIERVRATLEIASVANRQVTEKAVLQSLASGMLTRFAMQYALIAEKSPGGLGLTEIIGSIPAHVNPDALFGQRNPLRYLLQERSRVPEIGVLLVSNLDSRNEWHNSSLLTSLEARSLIGLQLDMGNDHLAGVLVIGQRSLPPFLDDDRRVFAQLAHQVSVGLQNLQLLNETRRRLQEVDLLLDFSRELGSLKPGEILASLIENVTQTLPNANSGWVGTWDEKELAIVPQAVTGYISNQDIREIRYALQTSTGEVVDTRTVLPLRIFRTGQPERISEVDFASQYHLSADDLVRYRRATNGKLPISAMLVPLQVGESVLGVLFLENFEAPDAFSEEDEALAASFSRQATMALENARLYQASERRTAQLQALTAVAGTITSSLQRDELISSLLDQLKLILPYDTATLWLRTEDHLRVAAATGFSDNELRLNLSVAVEDSLLFKTMIQTSEPISVGDLRNDRRFPSLVEPEFLSWLGIPLLYKSEVIGLIALEKREADFYSADYIQAGTAFASQAAVSLENARLYEESISRAVELDERSQRLGLLNRLSSELVASLDMDYIFKLSGEHLFNALAADGIAAVMLDSRRKYILQLELPRREDTVPIVLPVSSLFDHLQATQGIFQTDNVEEESALQPVWDAFLKSRQARSLLVVPLVSGSAMQGWFMVYRTQPYRYTLPEIELARTMCNQSAIAVQNARLFAETRRLTADLERRVDERTRELRQEHQNSQTLLRIITELSASLDMGLVLNRTLGVLNESLGCEESLIILSQGSAVHYRAGMQLAQLDAASISGVALERKIARWVVRSRQSVVVDRIQENERWEIPANVTVGYQSLMAVALVMGEDVLGSLLLFHRSPGFFSKNQIGLLEATARQIAIALNNAELFNLIRDQSEHLGSMLRDQQIESSRSRAILEAVADGVLVTDAQNRITLFNASAERILSLSSSQMMAKSLDHFSGLFGKAAMEWMQTIQNWSQNPGEYQNVETYAEQLDLDNGRIVAVHLAPVFWRQEYLGTVSIFRDITHEVQVDRLKSEFVTNVSHELRTPMTSIKGYVEIMLMGAAGKLEPQQEEFLRIVESNTERLSVLVNDLLDISQIETGQISSNLQPIDLHEIANEVVLDIQNRSKEDNRPMLFELQAEPDLPFARGDAGRIRQVLRSLVMNGYNYTPENGRIRVSICNKGGEIQVDVKDNGIGIAPAVQHRIFERFFRGEDTLILATAGTGLGLAIAKTLVEMHQGRIWFESSGIKGEGSTFSFTLPVVENEV